MNLIGQQGVIMNSARSFLIEWKLKGTKGRFYMALGAIFLLFALVGILIPIVPQVPFAIISAFFFSKGSIKIHLWIRQNRLFGRPVREWEDFRIIRPRMKIIATISIVGGAVLSHLKIGLPWAYAIDIVFAISIAFVVTRRSKIFSLG